MDFSSPTNLGRLPSFNPINEDSEEESLTSDKRKSIPKYKKQKKATEKIEPKDVSILHQLKRFNTTTLAPKIRAPDNTPLFDRDTSLQLKGFPFPIEGTNFQLNKIVTSEKEVFEITNENPGQRLHSR